METKFTCPRRVENGMDRADAPFRGSGPNQDTYERGRGLVNQRLGCSYCGSMSGDDFMEAVKAGVEIGPTDKNYKAYVGADAGKFYFMHLSEEQMQEFLDLLIAKKIVVGYPGRFYVLPFFIGTKSRD